MNHTLSDFPILRQTIEHQRTNLEDAIADGGEEAGEFTAFFVWSKQVLNATGPVDMARAFFTEIGFAINIWRMALQEHWDETEVFTIDAPLAEFVVLQGVLFSTIRPDELAGVREDDEDEYLVPAAALTLAGMQAHLALTETVGPMGEMLRMLMGTPTENEVNEPVEPERVEVEYGP